MLIRAPHKTSQGKLIEAYLMSDSSVTGIVVVVVDFYFASQGQTGNGAQFYGSEFQKGESYGEREREREREGGGREGGR